MSSNVQQTRQTILNSYNKRLQDDVHAMIENFSEIIKSARIEENSQIDRVTQTSYDLYQMQVRAANVVRAGESLLKLISELKTFEILYDFPSINRHISTQNEALDTTSNTLKEQFIKLKEEFSVALFDLESEYCCSIRTSTSQ